MTAHEKFESKCSSLLLEGRKQNGEFGTKNECRISYESAIKNYYKAIALKFDLFSMQFSYFDNYVAEKKHNEALKKQCKAYQASIDYCHSIITLQSDTIINLKETIAKNKGK